MKNEKIKSPVGKPFKINTLKKQKPWYEHKKNTELKLQICLLPCIANINHKLCCFRCWFCIYWCVYLNCKTIELWFGNIYFQLDRSKSIKHKINKTKSMLLSKMAIAGKMCIIFIILG